MQSNLNETCIFRGPPGLATPYIKNMCFQAPYQNGGQYPQKNRNCINTYSSRGTCLNQQECFNVNNRCSRGKCSYFKHNNPYMVGDMSNNNLPNQNNNFIVGIGWKARSPPIIVQKNGSTIPVWPLETTGKQPNNCKKAIQTMFQCERFGDNTKKGLQCQKFKNCFVYDIDSPNREQIDIGIVATPTCKRVADFALNQAISQCGTSIPCDMKSTQYQTYGSYPAAPYFTWPN